MFAYRSIDPGDKTIFTSDKRLEKNPDGYVQIQMVYHIEKTDELNADYSVQDRGQENFYRFTSETGRAAYKKGGRVRRTTDPNAVTCPDCRSKLNLEMVDLMSHLAREEDNLPADDQLPS